MANKRRKIPWCNNYLADKNYVGKRCINDQCSHAPAYTDLDEDKQICLDIPDCTNFHDGGVTSDNLLRCDQFHCDIAPAYSKKWADQRVQPPIICSKLNFCEDGAIAKCDGRDTACDTYLSEVEDTNKESKLASQSKRVHNLQQQQKIEDDQVFSKVSWISKVNKEVTDLVALISEKQEAYGDSFGQSGKIIEVLYPDGIKPEQYKDALTIIRIIDKLFRIANKKDAFGETPWRDITGYALLSLIRDIEESRKEHLRNMGGFE